MAPLRFRFGARLALTLLLGSISSALWGGEEPAPGPGMGLVLPSQIDVQQLVGIVGEMAGISVQFDPAKVTGTVRIDVRQAITPAQSWSVLNQVLLQRGFTTVVAGQPPIYHVVPLSEAESTGLVFTKPADAEAISPPPGHLTLVQPLQHITPEAAIQALGPILGQKAQAKAVGKDLRRLVLTGDRERVLAGLRIIDALDRPGNDVEFQSYQPRYAATGKLLTAVTSAWSAADKVSGRQPNITVQLMPDGQRLLVIAAHEDLPVALKLLADLDRAEPAVTRTYRSEHFRLEDIAQLVEQILGSGDERLRLVRDRLTGGLVVTATETQHDRVQKILQDLDSAPPGSRQTLRSFILKNRQAQELVAILRELTANGLSEIAGGPSGTQTPNTSTPPTNVAGPAAPTRPTVGAPPSTTTAAAGGGQRQDATFTIDAHTNSIVVLAQPRFLDQIAKLIETLDRRQPQVQLELTLVSLSEGETQAFGIEWAASARGENESGSIAQLFGLSKQGSSVLDRTATVGNGLTSLIMSPGHYTALIHALKTVNHGRNLVTSMAVVDNNAEATVDAVLQEPIANINSSSTVSTTSYGGTSDAGTKIKVKPLISAADHVQLTFSVSQSSFVGESIKTDNGGVVPPPKRQDAFASVVSIPDGHIIALGGISNQGTSNARSGLPFVSDIPLFGRLFSSDTNTQSTSRFYLLIRADVLRHPTFADLKYRAAATAATAGVIDATVPVLTPAFME